MSILEKFEEALKFNDEDLVYGEMFLGNFGVDKLTNDVDLYPNEYYCSMLHNLVDVLDKNSYLASSTLRNAPQPCYLKTKAE